MQLQEGSRPLRQLHLGSEQARAELVLLQVLAQQGCQGLQVLSCHQRPSPRCCIGCPAGLQAVPM